MVESSVICLLVLASHKAFNGYCVTFVKPSKNKMAAIFDLKLVKNGFKTCSPVSVRFNPKQIAKLIILVPLVAEHSLV